MPRTPATKNGPKVVAGPKAETNAKGEVLPISETAYPSVVGDALLRCLGACGEVKAASRFQFHGPKAEGNGRYLECTACQLARLEENKARKAKGKDALPRPRATVAGAAKAAPKASKAPAKRTPPKKAPRASTPGPTKTANKAAAQARAAKATAKATETPTMARPAAPAAPRSRQDKLAGIEARAEARKATASA